VVRTGQHRAQLPRQLHVGLVVHDALELGQDLALGVHQVCAPTTVQVMVDVPLVAVQMCNFPLVMSSSSDPTTATPRYVTLAIGAPALVKGARSPLPRGGLRRPLPSGETAELLAEQLHRLDLLFDQLLAGVLRFLVRGG
jgi:hypothetical protein